jgi:hypothetical protein
MKNGTYALLALVATVALGIAGCGSTHGKTETLNLTEPGGNTGTFGVIGKASQNAIPTGSGFAFGSPLVDGAKKSAGALHAVCIATAPSKGNAMTGTCTATAAVPGGSLALNAGGNVGGNVNGSITGGTGKYAGATGTFKSVQTGGNNGPNHDTFSVTMP